MKLTIRIEPTGEDQEEFLVSKTVEAHALIPCSTTRVELAAKTAEMLAVCGSEYLVATAKEE